MGASGAQEEGHGPLGRTGPSPGVSADAARACCKVSDAGGSAAGALAPRPGGARAAAASPDATAAAKLQLDAAAALGPGPRALSCTLRAIHDLDAESIELIFAFLPPEDRRSAAAVCRLWRRIHNSSTRLWGTVLLSGERVLAAAASAAAAGSVGAWLAARLEAMRAVRLWSPGAPLEAFASSLAALLSRENRVQSFSYVCGGDASVSRLLGELQRLTSLQRLDVLAPWAAAPGQGLVVFAKELAKLKPLRNLLSLQLHAREIRGPLPPALFRRLARLQHLSISARCRLPAAVVRQLSGLRSLQLHGASLDAEAAAAATALQQLTQLGIGVEGGWPGGPGQAAGDDGSEAPASGGTTPSRSASAGSVDSAGGGQGSPGKRGGAAAAHRWQEHAIWGALPLLGQLAVLAVGADLPSAGAQAGAGYAAGGDEVGGGEGGGGSSAAVLPSAVPPAILPYASLEGSVPDGIMDCPGLTHLALPVALTHLPDLVPGQLPRLASLDLTHCIAEALPPSWCFHAQRLRRLVLNGSLAGGRLPAELAALAGLSHLELRACRLRALPRCVAGLPALACLDLGLNQLTDLPAGPYLARLRHLVLRGNALPRLPPALAAATRLETLDAGENDGLVLSEADVGTTLAPLPALRLLVLARQPHAEPPGFGPYLSAHSGAAWDAASVAALMQLARALPQLTVQLERAAPPCLPPCACGLELGLQPPPAAPFG